MDTISETTSFAVIKGPLQDNVEGLSFLCSLLNIFQLHEIRQAVFYAAEFAIPSK